MVVMLEIGGPIKTEAMYGRTALTPRGMGLWTAHVLHAFRDSELAGSGYLSSPPPPLDSHHPRVPTASGDARPLCMTLLEAEFFCLLELISGN
jgi:hypothetical protein